jgi:uncharacterized Zn finger protein (UPF0148 family)
MTCPRCHTEIAEGALVCPVCGDWYAASAQKERVDALKSKAKTIVHDSFHSGMFLAMTVLMTVTAAARLLCVPEELIDFKLRGMKERGFDINAPYTAQTDFLKNGILL